MALSQDRSEAWYVIIYTWQNTGLAYSLAFPLATSGGSLT
jgi:hypothetical protein